MAEVIADGLNESKMLVSKALAVGLIIGLFMSVLPKLPPSHVESRRYINTHTRE